MGDGIFAGEQKKTRTEWFAAFLHGCFYNSDSCFGLAGKLICDLTIEKKKKSLKLMLDEDNLTLCKTSEVIRNNERNCKISSST